MVFGLISHGYCGQETNHRMFAFFNFFFTPFAWHNSLQDTTLYNTPSLSYIYSFWPNSMHAVSREHKTQFFNPSQWQPWEFSNKKNYPFFCSGEYLWMKQKLYLSWLPVNSIVSFRMVLQFLIVLLQSCCDWLENNKVRSYPSSYLSS